MKADIRSLTGVRGVAAVIILIYHFSKFRLDPASSVVVWAVPHGYLAVDMFFMLSGFVIGFVYKDFFFCAPLPSLHRDRGLLRFEDSARFDW
jgi:peptidoglycan/LPS O-acetylase OafA/YrhL